MPPRQIPINGRGQRTTNAAPPWQSSLDLVFSFSRSQAFFGENLPSSPSFVQRYTIPHEDTPTEEDTEDTGDDDTEDYDESDYGDGFEWEAAGPSSGYTRGNRLTKQRSRLSQRSANSKASASENTPLLPTTARRASKAQGGMFGSRRASQAPGGAAALSGASWEDTIEEMRGESTFGQTLFNAVNALIGVGLLALPLAFAYCGWILGSLLLVFCALITNYTAKMLARMMATDVSLATYADVLIKAFGPKLRGGVYSLFALELGALSIALVVLFADSMTVLFPSYSETTFKLIGLAIILPTTYLPLRLLSITSLLGIASSLILTLAIIIDGFSKNDQPGSLLHPAPTSLAPSWLHVPLALGLLMSGFSGHAIIPSLYRDMREPARFNQMINYAYLIALVVSLLIGISGYLMFGNAVHSEITRDLLTTPGFPSAFNTTVMAMVALNPVVKFALASRPLVATIEHLVALCLPMSDSSRKDLQESAISFAQGSAISSPRAHQSSATPRPPNAPLAPIESDYLYEDHSTPTPTISPTPPSRLDLITTFFIRPGLTAFTVLLAIVIPDFARVLAFLGSASAFVICCIGPIAAYLIFGSPRFKFLNSPSVLITIHAPERLFCWFLLFFSIACAVIGTIFTFLPNL